MTLRTSLLMFVLFPLAFSAPAQAEVRLSIGDVVHADDGGSFLVHATPTEGPVSVGAYAVGLLIDEYVGLDRLDFEPQGLLVNTTEAPFCASSELSDLPSGSILEYCALSFGTVLPAEGAPLLKVGFGKVGGLASSESFQVSLVAENPPTFITAVGDEPIALGEPVTISGLTSVILGDFNSDGLLNEIDIDLLSSEVSGRTNTQDPVFDLDKNGLIENADRDVWVNELKYTYYGDSNFDGQFNSSDLIFVLQGGEYEDGINLNSGWREGDWNGNGDFESSDWITALQTGAYELGPRPTAAISIPEPTSQLLLIVAMASGLLMRRSRIRRR